MVVFPVIIVYSLRYFYNLLLNNESLYFFFNVLFSFLPVILSNYYDLPFNDILDWKKFSLILTENDVYELKSILKSISDEDFAALHKGLMEVSLLFIPF